MKKTHEQKRRICNSLYHNPLFRAVLVIVGIDMIVLGFSFAIGIDIMSFAPQVAIPLRIIFGLMYILVALFVIHYALAYRKFKKDSHFVCHHCAHKK